MWIEKTVDRASSQKLYVQIYNIMKEKIDQGDWPVNTLIPSEDELCRLYNVSKATVRIAVSELVRGGYLRRQQGKGTFVTRALPQMGLAVKTVLTDDLFGGGVMVKRSLVRRAIASQAEAVRYLNAPGEVIHYIICKGAVNDEPVYADELFLPHAFFPDVNDMEVCGIHFFEMIQEHSTRRLEKILQTIELGRVRADAAQVLGIKEGATVLLFHRLVIGVDGGPIAYRKITSNGIKYKFLTEFERIR